MAQITLTIDGVAIDLAESADGRSLVASATVGPLSSDRGRQESQMRKILEANLAHLYNCRAGARLDVSGDVPVLMVECAYDYGLGDMNVLAALIGETLHLRGTHGARIDVGAQMRGQDADALEASAGALVFRL
ncbi:MAG: hypothetical protein ACR652_13645 [Methylocystis sp.]|uniref:hypothetical protein n=1 Tax=Methylocystis sp. TaxID=1911079 RepID=UPI003DA5EC7C